MRDRGVSNPPEVMDSFEKLHKIALENPVDFEELYVQSMEEVANGRATGSDLSRIRGRFSSTRTRGTPAF
ncbi:hypothetical protein DMH03_28755 [Amycolatopsis sp. WAC 01376]|nr:hypothetical protein DMH03_28755 [Amycolatopsis sp. WAC 01376]